ncbi:hypothetical protein [Clostridium estertheticum]|uniref:hypothetical protein n=1 Tax=Clostridium estertheticum TaxID=238834 RepID=UPI001CF24E61|nr:hypothetical protein [Clostridium estertheticum]MCB2362186.1 hypothetical protein [Clostridium estertheticum]
MNKHLLSIVIAGVLGVTSLSTVAASAAVLDTSVTVSQSNIRLASTQRIVKPGTDAYTSKSPSGKVGFFAAGAHVTVYNNRDGWARVRGTLASGEEGSYYILADQLY